MVLVASRERKRQKDSSSPTPGFKMKVTSAPVRADKALVGPVQQLDLHPHQIRQWKGQLLEDAAGILEADRPNP